MSKEIIINSDQKQTRIAIVESGKLVELFIETKEVERTIGNLFLGKVRRVMPSIQAAFVDIGQKQDAFLHFSDLVDNIPDWLNFVKQDKPEVSTFKAEFARQPIKGRRSGSKDGPSRSSSDDENSDYDIERIEGSKQPSSNRGESINPVSYLKRDLPVLVRISKEPISSKGSRVTTDISLAGRFLVLVPMAGYVAVSKKIVSFKERRRLKVLAKSLVPNGFGVIVRTVAEGHNAKSLDTDLRLLIQKWDKVEESLAQRPELPCEIHEDVSMASSIIRDFFSEDFDRIVIDNERLYRNIKGYVQAVAPKMASRVQSHQSETPLFRTMKIEKAVDQAFSSRVDMPSGGYLFIEQTEAMHVVDVNSGRAGRGLSQEENSVRVNLEAATLIAEQVRLRDLGGILVVDFIDMRQSKNRRKVYDQLRREFRKDRAVTKVLQMSDFGLIQITRQRLRPSITTTFSNEDSGDTAVAQGTGKSHVVERASHQTVEPEDLIRKIEDWIAGYKESGKKGPIKLRIHPFTASYLNRGFPGQTFRWYLKHRVKVKVEIDEHIDPLSFHFIDMGSGQGLSSRPGNGAESKSKEKTSSSDRKTGGRSGKQDARSGSRSTSRDSQKRSSQGGGRRGQNKDKSSTQTGEESRDSANKPSSSRKSSSSRSSSSRSSSRSSGASSRDSSSRNTSSRGTSSRGSSSRNTSSRKADESSRDSKSRDKRSEGSAGQETAGRDAASKETSNPESARVGSNGGRNKNVRKKDVMKTVKEPFLLTKGAEQPVAVTRPESLVVAKAPAEQSQPVVHTEVGSKTVPDSIPAQTKTPSPAPATEATSTPAPVSRKAHKYKVDLRSNKSN